MKQIDSLLESDPGGNDFWETGVGDKMKALFFLYRFNGWRVVDWYWTFVCSDASLAHFSLKSVTRFLKVVHLKVFTRIVTFPFDVITPLVIPKTIQRTNPSVIRPRIVDCQ